MVGRKIYIGKIDCCGIGGFFVWCFLLVWGDKIDRYLYCRVLVLCVKN